MDKPNKPMDKMMDKTMDQHTEKNRKRIELLGWCD